ncbi:hypothetical protein CB0101_04450 [Synechococcus sp. CB0101]|uniref:hypothetical protein n=1 Tax=Synechococcus sp. CB0101 TaxID=232348 RepID=UPI0010AB3E15|nr:hypothetical protein [Synechococcus sp. CB0101]QCH14274.1 hypothetical protein CB0101_04450 [Synechococcus sp. CB0101]
MGRRLPINQRWSRSVATAASSTNQARAGSSLKRPSTHNHRGRALSMVEGGHNNTRQPTIEEPHGSGC